jgi:hypothetical protein
MRILILAFAFWTISLPAAAQDRDFYPVGAVMAIEGTAFSFNGESRKQLKVDDQIYMKATLETGANSKLLILLIDDTQITLAENSELVIDEFIIDPYEPEENEGAFNLPKGAFHWLGGMLDKRERPNVHITTAIGSIGIRGTEFFAGQVAGGHGVFVDSGLVNFAGAWGELEIPGGSGVFIADKPQTLPDDKYWNSANKAIAMERVTFGIPGLEEKIKAERKENIRKRNDYRGHAFPYKPTPKNYRLNGEEDEFFTDEFNEMRDNR